MKALIIGATGFIGSHIARACLQAGWAVRVTRRNSSSLLALEDIKDRVDFVEADLLDVDSLIQAMKGCDCVFNTAGYYPLYSFDIDGQEQKALEYLSNLTVALEKCEVPRLVYMSSMSTMGLAQEGQLADETTPYDPSRHRGAYYRIKYAVEQKLLEEISKGLPALIVNPTGVYGTHDVKPTSGAFITMVAKGRVPALVDRPINIIDAHDVGRLAVAAAARGRIGQRYLLGGTNTSTFDFAMRVAALAGVKGPSWRMPLSLLKGLARSSEYVSRFILHANQPLLPSVGVEFVEYGQHYDDAKARKELDSQRRPLDQTIAAALQWFTDNKYI
jgi:dihydroflavonol-4-reductase